MPVEAPWRTQGKVDGLVGGNQMKVQSGICES